MKKYLTIIDKFDNYDEEGRRKVEIIEANSIGQVLFECGCFVDTTQFESLQAFLEFEGGMEVEDFIDDCGISNGDGMDYVEVYEMDGNELKKVFPK